MKTVNLKKYFIFGTLVDLQNETKIRWVNNEQNIRTYESQGHYDRMMIVNDEALNKYESVKYMLTLPEFQQHDRFAALTTWLEKNEQDYVKAMAAQSQQTVEEEVEDHIESTEQEVEMA